MPAARADAADRRRPHRSRVGLVLFAAVSLLVVWELAARTAGLGTPPGRLLGRALGGVSDLGRIAYQAQPYVGFGLTPDYEWSRPDPAVPVRTNNNLGFRGPDTTRAKPDGTFRIVCLGGSTTFSDVVDDDETYPVHLQRELRAARPDLDIEVINAGVPSYTSAESLANLAFRVLDLSPDMIVIYHAANDWRPRLYPDFRPDYFHYRKPWDGSDRLQQQRADTDMAGGINTVVQWLPPEDAGDPQEHARRAGPGAFRRNLVSMIGVARAHGVTPVLVSFAAKGPDPAGTPGLLAGVAEHNRVLGEVAAEHGVALVDLDGRLSREGTFASKFGEPDPVHLNATGTRAKAAIIAEGIAPLLP